MTGWTSAHVYYHGDQTALLLDGVRPLFDRLGGAGVPAYFVPHWKLGPHVRLSFAADRDVVEPALTELVGGYLREHPSTATLDAAALSVEHRKLGRLEQEPGPFLPWQPDNSIRPALYDRRLHVHGTVEAAELMADFYSGTTGSAFAMLAAVRDGRQVPSLAFDTMAASAHGLDDAGLSSSFVSFRSHAEAFLSTWDEGEGLRPAWDEHYRTHRDSLIGRLTALTTQLDAGTPPRLIGHWLDEARSFGPRAAALAADGKLRLGPPPEGRQEYDRVLATYLQRSEFHRLTMGDRELSREVEEADWFVTRRMYFNYTYLQLTRVGLTPIQRFLLCHLLANAVEDLYGVSAVDVALSEPRARRHEGAQVPLTRAPEVRERLRMREGVHTLTDGNGGTHLVRWPHSIALGSLEQGAKDVLWRLSAQEQDIDGLVRGDIEHRVLVERLRDNGWLAVSVHHDGELVYTAVPAGAPRPMPERARVDPGGKVTLSKFASVDSDGEGLRLSSPRAGVTLKLGNRFVLDVLDALTRHQDPPTGALADRVREDLHAHGFVVGVTAEDDLLDTAQWSQHELRFHHLSRQPLNAGTADQLLRLGPGDWFAGRSDLPTEAPEPFAGERIALPAAPEAGGLSLAEALERRRSVRAHAPLDVAELGEFLRRSAAVQHREGGVTARPYPNGGSAHELEIYPVVRDVAGLAPGMYHYDADAHALETVCPQGPAVSAMLRRAARAMGTPDALPPVLLVVSARFGRVMATYQAIAYGMTLKHAGALIQTMYLVATDLGLAPCAVEAADYDGFETATGRDRLRESTVAEFVLGKPV